MFGGRTGGRAGVSNIGLGLSRAKLTCCYRAVFDRCGDDDVVLILHLLLIVRSGSQRWVVGIGAMPANVVGWISSGLIVVGFPAKPQRSSLVALLFTSGSPQHLPVP